MRHRIADLHEACGRGGPPADEGAGHQSGTGEAALVAVELWL